MKTLKIIYLMTVIFFSITANLKAQDSITVFDTLKTGKIYKVQIDNGWETEGRLVRIDSNSIDIKSEYKVFTIMKSEIESITAEYSKFQDYKDLDTNDLHNMKLFLSLGSGLNIIPASFGNKYLPGVNFQINITKIVSTTHAIRGDFQFSYNSRKGSDYYEGGNLNGYALKFDFLLGRFRTHSKVNGYVILGGGLTIFPESEVKHNYVEYSYKPADRIYLNLEAGGGLGYKISDRVKLYGEGLYSFPFADLGKNGGASIYGIFFGYPSLKIGVQIEL